MRWAARPDAGLLPTLNPANMPELLNESLLNINED
jgi:hypothetical protein